MQKCLIVKEDGLIYVNEVPEEPEYNGEIGHSINVQKQYYEQLEVAKKNAVLVSNHNQAFFIIQDHFMPKGAKEFKLLPGIYPIKGLDWEVGSKCELWCSDCKAFDWSTCRKRQVAILKESTPSRGDAHKRFLDSRRRFFEGNWNKESTPLTEEGTLEDYLKRNKDKHEFRLVIHEDGRGYIHALGQDSETLDFQL